MDIQTLLAQRKPSLTKSEQTVAQFIQENMHEIVLMPLQVLAKNCETSEATVLRFCRSLGFSGYQDFKSTLVTQLVAAGNTIDQEFSSAGVFSQKIDVFAKTLVADITSTLANLEESALIGVADALVSASCIATVAVASSAGSARVFSDSLMSVGIRCSTFSDRVEIERYTRLMGYGDVLVGLSHSGETEEIVHAVRRAKEQGATTVAVTNFAPSALADMADFVLLTSMPESFFRSFSCIPSITQLALLQVVINLVSDKLGGTGTP